MFVFSTRTSLEFVFQPLKSQDNDAVDVMLVGSDAGIKLVIYDTFVIGSFRHPAVEGYAHELRLRGHASHTMASTYSLLLSPPAEDSSVLYLAPLDLTFIHSSPIDLSLLASKTTTLQKLLRYVNQTQIHIRGEWQAKCDLPKRLMAAVQDDLENLPAGSRSISEAFYHTAVTGHTYPVVKEWLVDVLAERVSLIYHSYEICH
jgi:anaphase-promoting complex subunit 4